MTKKGKTNEKTQKSHDYWPLHFRRCSKRTCADNSSGLFGFGRSRNNFSNDSDRELASSYHGTSRNRDWCKTRHEVCKTRCFLISIAFAFNLTSAFAAEVEVNLPGHAQGTLTTIPVGTEQFPTALVYSGADVGKITTIEVYQTHTYAGNTYVDIPDAAIFSAYHGGPSALRQFNIMSEWASYATTDFKKFGTYTLKILGSTEQSSAVINQFEFTWNVNAPVTGGGGQGISPGDLNGQPVNQGSFWQGVFGPTTVGQTRLESCLYAFSTWGPLNIYNDLVQLFSYVQPDYESVYLGIATVDLRPFQDLFVWGRAIMSGIMWFFGVTFVWKRFLEKV